MSDEPRALGAPLHALPAERRHATPPDLPDTVEDIADEEWRELSTIDETGRAQVDYGAGWTLEAAGGALALVIQAAEGARDNQMSRWAKAFKL